MRILIVDDNASLRQLLASLFTKAGHEVVAMLEDGGPQVEEKIRRLLPDLVCLDYNLPGRDGISILKSIQTIAPQIDVLFMTASGAADIEQCAADAGASGFIRKPFGQMQIMRELALVSEARKHAPHIYSEPSADETALPHLDGQRPDVGTAVIADDSGAVRMLLKGLLKECGLKVVQTVANGNEAVAAARNHRPRILCLDVNMPEMGGLEALPLIRQISPETAVVMVTGSADKAFVARAASHGASGYILKPLRPAHVIEYMKRLLK